MKKYLFGMAACTMLFVTSCEKEIDFGTSSQENVSVSFNINTPAIATRAYSDGASATVLQYAVYDAKGNKLVDLGNTLDNFDGSEKINIELATGNTYSVIFWAAAPNAPYTVDFDEKTMTVDYDGALCNDENRDAFYKYHSFRVTGAQTETIELKRPFAQLNIGTNDYDKAALAGYTPEKSTVTVGEIYTTLDLVEGNVSGATSVTFANNDIPNGETFPVDGYEYLAMNYLLVHAEQSLVEVTFSYRDDVEARTVGSVPVCRNYRTNIYGKLLTSTVDINVEIVPEYDEPSFDQEILNLIPVYYDEAEENPVDGAGMLGEDTYGVYTAEGLQWIADQINGTSTSLPEDLQQLQGIRQYPVNGKTIKLLADIDLHFGYMDDGDPITFTPIGDKTSFSGEFNGNNHTIKNLYQNGWALGYEWGAYGSLGLFANLKDATVKNVVIEGMEALVEGGDISFIAGSATGTCVFEDITINNSKIGTYNNGIGGIIGWSGAGNYTFKNITLGEDVVLGGLWGSFDSSVGGIVGQAEPGATYNFENVEINCRIDAYNDVTASYDYYNYRMCGMIIGRCAETTTIDGRNYPDLSKYNMSFNNVVVNYGTWMNYHYCRPSEGRGTRVEAGYAYGGIAADHDHSTCTMHHYNCIPFDQLIGGAQYGVKGLREVAGVTVNYPAEYTCDLCGEQHNVK